ncbi:MAG: hypothetical protein H0V44_04030 [Planctomycetes bacterium]|nr:hypothetical protein [Planctomycetota bacterium]
MKMTPHVFVAAALVLVALIAAVVALLDSGTSFPVPTRDLRVLGPAADTSVMQGQRALASLMPEFDGPIANPFSPRKGTTPNTARIPLPPAPPLDAPALPVLPLSEK